MNSKMDYTAPDAEISLFSTYDPMTVSGGGIELPDDEW